MIKQVLFWIDDNYLLQHCTGSDSISLGERGSCWGLGGKLKSLQMNAKTRSVEAFFSLGSGEDVLTPGVDSQFYGPVFVFLRICLSIFFLWLKLSRTEFSSF